MGNVTLNGSTSGSITLAPPSVAGTNTISLPAQTATVLTDSSAAMNIGSGQIYKDASGNVGIGLTSLTEKFEVSGSVNASTASSASFSTGNQRAFMDYVPGSTTARFGHLSGASGSTTGVMAMFTNGTERARIDSSGNLLVGATATNPSSGIVLGSSALGSGNGITCATTLTTNAYAASFKNGNGYVGAIITSGTSTSYNTTSDYRLKENVQPMTTGLSKISALKPVTYDWINDKSLGEGFIAHELQEVIPHAVTGEKDAVDADGNPIHQGVDYSKIVVHLVAAMQEQQSIIEDLKSRLAVLEAK